MVKIGKNCADVVICFREYIIFGGFSYIEKFSPYLLEDAKTSRTQG